MCDNVVDRLSMVIENVEDTRDRYSKVYRTTYFSVTPYDIYFSIETVIGEVVMDLNIQKYKWEITDSGDDVIITAGDHFINLPKNLLEKLV